MQRVNVYIDGFNLYFGIISKYRDSKWLDIKQLCESITKSGQSLHEVKYFTSRISNNPEKQKRQTTYLEALSATGVRLIYGHYKDKQKECFNCGNIWNDHEEKMTDVNIATHMIFDAVNDLYDVAILISGDTDLVPPINAIKKHYQEKRIVIAFPPNRSTKRLKAIADASFVIGRKKLQDNQLPEQVNARSGYILKKPKEWN